MADGAASDIGDDLHVDVGMRGKATCRGDLVVVPHQQRAPGVFSVIEAKVMPRLEPGPLMAGEGSEWPMVDHDQHSRVAEAQSSLRDEPLLKMGSKLRPRNRNW